MLSGHADTSQALSAGPYVFSGSAGGFVPRVPLVFLGAVQVLPGRADSPLVEEAIGELLEAASSAVSCSCQHMRRLLVGGSSLLSAHRQTGVVLDSCKRPDAVLLLQ